MFIKINWLAVKSFYERLNSFTLYVVIVILMVAIPNILYAQQKAPDTYFYVNSKKVHIKSFEGKKVMLWLFSTWCPSCISGFSALAEKQPELKKDNLTIIVLRNYKNGGYPGPTVTEFAEEYGKDLLKAENWVFGEASEDLENKYNSKNYPDIYYLINEKGKITKVNGAPAATLDGILNFAGKK